MHFHTPNYPTPQTHTFLFPPLPETKSAMVTLESAQAAPKSTDTNASPKISFSSDILDDNNFISLAQEALRSIETTSSPRISFSSDFLDDKNFISLSPSSGASKALVKDQDNFEFLSMDPATETMLTADELFFEGKLIPAWKKTPNKISIGSKDKADDEEKEVIQNERRVSWFIDEDPSPRPPKCTLLWKELLRLKKQRASALSPSSSTSSSSSSDLNKSSTEGGKADKESSWNRQKHVKRIKQTLERTRSASMKIKPVAVVSMPICTQGKDNGLPPSFSFKKKNVQI